MSYVLGSLGGLGSLGAAPTPPPMEIALVMQGVGLVSDPILRPKIKVYLLANPGASNWRIFNGLRFDDPNISDAQAEQRAGKQQYVEPYKSFRNAVHSALKPMNKTAALANTLRYHSYNLINQERQSLTAAGLVQPPSSGGGGGGGGADRASTPTDNTMLYVAGAAVLALVAVGAMRRKA